MKNVEHSFKLVALVILAGVVVAFVGPGRARTDPPAPAAPAAQAAE